jgi:hypothetical protein
VGLALAFLSASVQGGEITVLGYAQTNPLDVVTGTNSAGVTTLSTAGNADGGGVSIPVVIANLNNTPGVNIPAFETFVDVHTTGPAITFSGQILQSVVGTIEFSSGVGGTGVNYLTATFTDTTLPGTLNGFAGGAQLSLGSTDPPQSLTLTSGLVPKILTPTSLTLAFSDVTPGLSITGGSISSFTGQFAGTIGGTPIPEPSTLAMGCIALIFGTAALRSSRRRRRETANA